MQIRDLPISTGAVALSPLRALPAEWETWAEEPARQVSAEEDGETVGAVHLALVSASEAWLEGVRVRRDRQGRGIAGRLVREAEALARRYGASVVRTAVPAHEYAALAVAEHAGYGVVTRAIVSEGVIAGGPIDVPYDAHARDAGPDEVAAILARLSASDVVRSWRGLVPLGWRFRTLRPELIRGLVRDRRVLRTGEGVEGVACFALHADAAVILIMAAGGSHAQALVGVVAERARSQGLRRLAVFAPDEDTLAPLRLQRAPHPWCPDGLVIVQKTISRDAPAGGAGAEGK